jgi:hypothetical protein
MGFLPGIDNTNFSEQIQDNDDLSEFRRHNVIKEKEFLTRLAKEYQIRNTTSTSKFKHITSPLAHLIGDGTASNAYIDHARQMEEILYARGTKKKFIRFSQAHQGVLQYLTLKNKMEKKAKEQKEKAQEQKFLTAMSIRPKTRYHNC